MHMHMHMHMMCMGMHMHMHMCMCMHMHMHMHMHMRMRMRPVFLEKTVRCSPLSLPHRDHAARALHWLRSWDLHL